MKRTVMAVLVAGMLLLSAGNAALATDETGGSHARPTLIAGDAAEQCGGNVRFCGVPGEQSDATAGALPGGVTHDTRVLSGGARGGIVEVLGR